MQSKSSSFGNQILSAGSKVSSPRHWAQVTQWIHGQPFSPNNFLGKFYDLFFLLNFLTRRAKNKVGPLVQLFLDGALFQLVNIN